MHPFWSGHHVQKIARISGLVIQPIFDHIWQIQILYCPTSTSRTNHSSQHTCVFLRFCSGEADKPVSPVPRVPLPQLHGVLSIPAAGVQDPGGGRRGRLWNSGQGLGENSQGIVWTAVGPLLKNCPLLKRLKQWKRNSFVGRILPLLGGPF